MLGISRRRVNQLAQAGKITREKDGNWDAMKVFGQLGRNLDTRQPSKALRLDPPAGQGRDIGDRAGGNNPEPRRGTLLYEQYRLTREKAHREELERKTLEGALFKREDIRKAVSNMISAVKTKLLTLGDELSDRLAATSDPIACRELVDERIHLALTELAEYPVCA